MTARKLLAFSLGLTLLLVCLTPAVSEADFGIKSVTATAFNQDGSIDTQAGSHPYAYTVKIEMNLQGNASKSPEGTLHSLIVDLPPGMIANPVGTPRCSRADFEGITPHCPPDTQVGIVHVPFVTLSGEDQLVESPVYNTVPPLGTAASLGLSLNNLNSFQEASARTDGDYGARVSDVTIPSELAIQSVTETIWGVPGSEDHRPERVCPGKAFPAVGGPTCASEAPLTPFFTLPTSCTGPLQTTVQVESLESMGFPVRETVLSKGDGGNPAGLDGCNALEFEPEISSQPTTNHADSPTGLDVTVHQRQDEDFEGLATAALKDVKVTLPVGMTLNPSAGNGLAACSNAQIGYQPSGGKIHFSEDSQSCPDAAKVGSVQINSPLVDHKLSGSIYVAKPFENPFGSLLAIYLAIEDEQSGVIAKLAGKVEPDPQTGQLTASFTENPQLPIEDIETHFFNGARAALKTPLTCGTGTTTTTMVPWSTPEGADAHPSDFSVISVAAGGSGVCPSSEATAPNSPAFTAGTVAPEAGAYSPFVLKLSRPDGSQQLTGLDTTLPKGLTGRLAGIPYCPEADISAAKSREVPNQGAVEQADPSCPAASEVGTVTVGAGAGPTPLYVQGRAYLAGAYKGAPLSLVIITPAVAGPFDLGAVVVRTALYVDLFSAQIHAVSDPLPTIMQGIPLDVRSIAVTFGRPGFTLNPTSCDPTAITGSALALTGQSAALNERFQVGGCKALKFKPKLAISLKGAVRRTGHPALRAVVTYPKGGAYANIARASVALPHAEFLDQSNLDNVCTQPELATQTCPKRSIYGHVKAWTPLLDKPLEGNVYLGVGFGHQLPDLVGELNGQLRVLLHGKVDTDSENGIRNTFEAVPDAPVSKFVLEMQGGPKKGLLVNSENICAKTQLATANFIAQNGALLSLRPRIANSCAAKKSKGKHKGKR